MQFSDKEENYRLILIFGPPLRTINRGKDLAEWKNGATFVPGKLAEWSIAAVLKTVEPQGSGGSNPSLSAKKKKRVANRICNPFCIWAGLNIFGTGSNTKRNAAGPPFLGLAGTPPAGHGKTSGTKPSGGVQRSQFLNQGIPGITERRRRNSAILNSRSWPRSLPHWGARAFV